MSSSVPTPFGLLEGPVCVGILRGCIVFIGPVWLPCGSRVAPVWVPWHRASARHVLLCPGPMGEGEHAKKAKEVVDLQGKLVTPGARGISCPPAGPHGCPAQA